MTEQNLRAQAKQPGHRKGSWGNLNDEVIGSKLPGQGNQSLPGLSSDKG